jgi:putative phage-type endonuclease
VTATEHAAWLEGRRKGIGSSDAASVCGIPSAFGTPFHVYANKVWGVDVEETEAMRIGTMIEPVVAKLYQERVCPGCEIAKPSQRFHPERKWQTANIDLERDDDRRAELKTSATRQGWGPDGSDEVPTPYFVQVQHQMIVCPAESMDLAALLCGNDFRVYEIRHVPDLAERITQIESEFWGLVERQECPPPDFAHSATLELIEKLNEPTPRLRIEATELWAGWAEGYQRIGKEASELNKQRDELKARLINAMGAASVMSLPDGQIIRRKPIARKAYSVAATTYVDFRFLKDKGASSDE